MVFMANKNFIATKISAYCQIFILDATTKYQNLFVLNIEWAVLLSGYSSIQLSDYTNRILSYICSNAIVV